MNYVLIFVFQTLFNIFKTLEIKYTYENRVKELLFNSVWINLVSLGSMFLSLERLLLGEWSVLIVYISGSVFGKWLAMTKIKRNRAKKLFEWKKKAL
jgi:hypothetical protein